MLVAVLFTVSCDKNDEPDVNHAQDIAGKYEGYSVSEFQYTAIPITTPSENISITANENGTGTLSFESVTWGKFTIPTAEVTLTGNEYKIAGSGKTVMGMDPASQKEYDCTITGTISKDKKTVSILFEVPAVMGGLKITFTQGEAPASMVVAGVYNGTLELSVGSTNMDPVENSKVTIKHQENGKAEVTLEGFGEGGMAFQDIVIEDVEVTAKTDGSYSLTGNIDTMSGTTNVTGKLEGAIAKEGDANITFTLKPGAMPMNIIAVFTGE